MEMYYIQDKRQYVGNSMLWWAKNSKGYTCDIRNAQIFTETEAKEICDHRDTDVMWEISYIRSRVSHHIDKQHCDEECQRWSEAICGCGHHYYAGQGTCPMCEDNKEREII